MDTRKAIRERPLDFIIMEASSTPKARSHAYKVEVIAAGLAAYMEVSQVNYKDRGVVIAYDGSEDSLKYAKTCAAILGEKDIKVNIFSKAQPTVLLSYAVRYFGATNGLQIFKDQDVYSVHVFNESGNRLTAREMEEMEPYMVQASVGKPYPNQALETLKNKYVLGWIYDEISNAYLDRLDRLADKVLIQNVAKDIPIAVIVDEQASSDLLKKALERYHFQQVSYDTDRDEHMTTDIVLEIHGGALSVRVKNRQGEQEMLQDHALAQLLVDYMLSHSDKNLQHNARIIRASTSKLDKENDNPSLQVTLIETAPDFRHICEKIRQFDRTGETFLFGYDGCGGYLIDDFVRVKDAIQVAVVVCEMAQYYKNKNKTLLDAYQALVG